MSFAQDRLRDNYHYYAEQLGYVLTIEKVLRELGLIDLDMYLDFGLSNWEAGKDKGPYIRLEPRHISGIAITADRGEDGRGTIGMPLVDTTPTLAEAARALLPKIGRFEKSFDGDCNLIRLTAMHGGVCIILEDTPPKTCTVRKVEEEVEVPEKVIAAHTEKKVRYVLEGDCDPLLASTGQPIEDEKFADETKEASDVPY